METLEVTAKTVEEAIELALRQLDAGREEVEIDVVSRGRSGILGIGGEPARVRVTRIGQLGDLVIVVKDVLDNLLSGMGVLATAVLKRAEVEDGSGPVFDIQGDDSGLLIGRRGETLRAIQFLVNFIVSHRLQQRVSVVVDVEGYRERRHRSLTALALRLADRVVATGRSITLEPMPASERRVVHLALSSHAQVTTQSIGDGDSRKVTILPKSS